MQKKFFRLALFINFNVAILFFSPFRPILYAQAGTPVNFTVAFIGDQGLGENSRAVLNLIKSEHAAAVVHLGDFDYHDDPPAWDAQINDILGENYPYFACVGNHDAATFYGSNGYQEFMQARMNRLGITWNGDLGVKSSLKYHGIFFVLTAPGEFDSGHAEYIRDQLKKDKAIWSISGWHKNMKAMQVGSKKDDTGWGVYEESRKGGAIIATAHEHSYCRSFLLSDCENQTVASTSDTLILSKDRRDTEAVDEGKSFVFVSGLAGSSIRDQDRSGPWWASIYTSDQDANYGALFGVFNVNGMPNMAKFYFKDIDGAVPDSFIVISNVEQMPASVGADAIMKPARFSLSQNYPNPFNPETIIHFQLFESSWAEIKIFNTLGQEICTLIDAHYEPGSYRIHWDGRDMNQMSVPSGVYLYQLKVGDAIQFGKMSLLR